VEADLVAACSDNLSFLPVMIQVCWKVLLATYRSR